MLSQEARKRMSVNEVAYFKKYSDALGAYVLELELALGADLLPPKQHNLLVRAVKDCGTIQTSRGACDVKAGDYHEMTRADAEGLIRQGLLVEVSMQ